MNGTSGQNQADPRAAASSRLASLKRFLAAEPNNARLHRDVVDTAVAAGEFSYVRELAERRLADTPADPEAQFDRATALIGLKDFAGALEALQPLDATIPGVRFNLGLCLYMLDRHGDARPYFQAGYDAGERSPGHLRFFIRTLHHLGEIDPAVAIANENEQAVSSDGDLAGTCSLLYLDANDAPRSAACAQIALAANPNNVDALISLGTLRTAELDVSTAGAAFDHVLEIQPRNGRAWLGLGLLSTLAQDFAKAKEQLARAVELMPGHLGSWHSLAWAHLFSGDMAGAERHFAHALELDRNFGESHGAMAAMLAMKGNREAAEREIEIAVRLDRSGSSVQFARALLIGQASGQDASREFIQNAVRKLATRFDTKARAVLTQLTGSGPKKPY
jgi:tetratricopeptide (TPR) repeat protein